MEFAQWFEKKWKQRGETDTAALSRLSAETGISYKTLFYARKGARQEAETARKLVAFSGDKINGWTLIDGPHRSELTGTGG